MPIHVENQLGKINVSDQAIAALAGSAALDCYGLIGMSSRKQLKDGFAELFGRDNLGKGVEIRRSDDQVLIDLYIVVSYGTRISEVAHNVQTRVKYVLNDVAGLHVDTVNIFVQGVRVTG